MTQLCVADQGLEGGHDAKGDGRDDALQLAHLAEEPEQPERPQHPQLLDPNPVHALRSQRQIQPQKGRSLCRSVSRCLWPKSHSRARMANFSFWGGGRATRRESRPGGPDAAEPAHGVLMYCEP